MKNKADFSALLGIIYDAIMEQALRPRALNALSASLDSVVGNIFLRSPEKELYLLKTVTGADPDGTTNYREPTCLDIRGPLLLMNMGKVINEVEGFQNGGYEDSLIYSELVRHFQMRHSRTTGLAISPEGAGELLLMCSESRGNYSPQELLLLELFLSLIGRTLAMQRRMQEIEEQARDLVAALDGLPTAGIILTGSRKIVCMNRQAEELLKGPGLTVRHQHLQADSAGDTSRLEEAIAAAARQAEGQIRSFKGAIPLIRIPRAGQRALEVLATPLRPDLAIRTDSNSLATVLLLIYDPERRPTVQSELLEQLFDLTSSEAFVAARLAEGLSLKEIATLRNCSISTVRTHMKRVFLKTGATRQGELVQMVLGSPAMSLGAAE